MDRALVIMVTGNETAEGPTTLLFALLLMDVRMLRYAAAFE